MKRGSMIKISFLALFLFVALSLCAQGIQFFEGTWEEAKDQAAAEDKLIFVDAFAKWCGPCKRMAKNVFTNPAVGEYYNENFINLKIDMEGEMGLAFGRDYPVSAYPTLIYLDDQGEVVKKAVGGKDVKGFIDLGKSVVISFDRSGEYAELYDQGDRDFDLVMNYVRALNKANKSSLKISNDYLRSKPDLTGEERASFLFEALTQADSRIFDLFVEERDVMENIKGKEAVASKIEAACWNTLQNAMEYEVHSLSEEAKSKMKAHCGDKYLEFAREADYAYAKAVGDVTMMSESALRMADDLLSKKPEDLHLLAEDLYLYKSLDPMALEAAEKIMQKAFKAEETPAYLVTYAKILIAQKRNKKAMKSLDKALDMTGPGSMLAKEISELKDSIREG